MAREWQTKIDNTAPTDTGVLTSNEHNSIGEEQEALVKSSGLAPVAYDAATDTNQKQWSEAVARYSSAGVFATDGGAADAYVLSGITITGASEAVRTPQAYFEPMRVLWVPANSNTGPSTVNVFGVGLSSIRTYLDAALSGGEIVAGRPCMLRYDESANSSAGAFLIEPWADALLGAQSTGWRNSPIFPEVTSPATQKVTVSNLGGGTVEVASGETFVWRGWQEINTTSFLSGARQFATVANKTYHLRWHGPGTGDATPESTYPNGRFVLEDLADAGYNPSTLTEDDSSFDTTYNDMLVARVVTDGSNVPTITSLKNANVLRDQISMAFTATTDSGANHATGSLSTSAYDWARTPRVGIDDESYAWNQGDYGTAQDNDRQTTRTETSRYLTNLTVLYDYMTHFTLYLNIDA